MLNDIVNTMRLYPIFKGAWLSFMQKLEERLSIFKKRVYNQDDQQKWMKVLVPGMISSEDEENINYVKDLPWRASIVKDFFGQAI
jgi:hypothetical protein